MPIPHPGRRTVAVIPVRSLEGAKSRLGEALDPEERHALVERLLRRTIDAAVRAPGIDAVVVVSHDPAALALAETHGARGHEQRSQGLNHGLEEARAKLDPGDRLVVLPGDLPAADADAVAHLLAASDAAGAPSVVLVADRHGRGTNALVLDPATVIPFAFGGDSRDAHGSLARDAGARLVEPESPLALDVDTPEDLLLAEALAPEVRGVV